MKEFEKWLIALDFKYIRDNSQGIAYWRNGFWSGTLSDLWDLYNTPDKHKEQMKDTIVESVIEQFKQRSEVGIKKYNTTLDRTDLTRLEWLQHAQEEAMDLILYLEKLKQYDKE
jgi:hypothetical protein